ncbi:DC-STAMP domain-containing protein 2-like [Vespula squamosa]|uniref:DC-STAMP domain-containing protein 2-like n=1 Tax=Vespula squamosa TaxID=30214 RepID=A0ABD2AGE6_VESSQ
MAFFQLVVKAHRLEKLRHRYEDEKLKSIEISKGAKHLTWSQRFRHKKLRCKRKVKNFWRRITSFPEDSWLHKKAVLLRTNGTFENYILKSIFGFIGGVILTYIFFMFFVIQLNFSLTSATLLCSIIGVILTLGLSFSYGVRCVVFLLLPQFFSKRGRQALIAYAFILTLTGPGKNMLRNINVLTESLVCGQEILKAAVKSVLDLIKEPFYALKEAIMKVTKAVRIIVSKIKQTFIAIKRIVLSIVRIITAVFQWLGSIINICNKKLGTPFERCQRVFEGAVADCRAKLGPIFGTICDLTYIVGALCWVVKPLDFICMLVSYVADAIVGAVRKKIRRFTKHMKTMFYVKVKFSHSFHFEVNRTKTIHDIATNISAEIKSRTSRFIAVFDWVNFLTTFFIFFMLLRVLHYRHKWLTSERYNNRYITDNIRTIDLIRARQDKETILPLNYRERNRYVSLSSVKLIKTEKVKLAKSATFLSLTSIKICMYIIMDYSLYWILDTIRYHGRIQTQIDQPNSVGIYVSGTGFLAELYRSIIKAFTPHVKEIEINTVPCLPDPIPPNFDGYIRILTLIILCWIMKRVNHFSSRGSFVKYARRQLRRKFGINGETIERVTFKQRLMAVFPFLNKLFPQKEQACVLCGAVQRDDVNPHIKCPTPDCVGLFCLQCFADLQNICTICRSPLEYGDLSDMSEEIDSSDDQLRIVHEKRLKLAEAERRRREREKMDAKEMSKKREEVRIEESFETMDIEEEMDEDEFEDYEESSSTSIYSYSYQDDLTREPEIYERKLPFKDLEAQRLRDDVTIQIYNEPIARSIMLSSDTTTPSCFVVRAHRKVRNRLKKKPRSSFSHKYCYSSTSIIDSDYWPSDEVKEDEVIHIEINDGSKELLIKDKCEGGQSYSRVRRIMGALLNIPWIGRRGRKGLQPRRPSLIKRIIKMLNVKRSKSPVQTYRRIRSKKSDVEDVSVSSSPSSYSEDDDNDGSRLICKRQSTKDTRTKARRTRCRVDWEDPEDIIRAKDYKERKIICPAKVDDINWQYPCEKKFVTKDLPRHLETISKYTSYHEIDETADSTSSRRCVRKGDINILSDAKTSSNCQRTHTWNIVGEDESQNFNPPRFERKCVRAGKIKNDQDSMTLPEKIECIRTPMHEEEMDDKEERKKGVAKSEHRKKVKGSQLYDTLAGLELYGIKDKRKKPDKKKTATHPREETFDKVDIGTDSRDQSKAIQTKLVKCRPDKKDERKKCQKSKEICCKSARATESKEQRWKKCIEEYKKHKRHRKKRPSDFEIKCYRKRRGFKDTLTMLDKLYAKRKDRKEDRTSRRYTCDESHQFPEDEKIGCVRESLYPKDNQRQLISGFIPIMYPEHIQTCKPFYDFYDRDRERISRQEETSDVEPIFQQYSSRVYQREPHVDRLRYFDEAHYGSCQHEDDQTDGSSHREYYSDDNDEDITTCTDNKTSSSESLSSSFERSREDACHYKENIHYTESQESFQPPMIRKYLPMYQRSELIEELKEHDRMRLIREREAVRCVSSNPLDSRKLSFVAKMQESQTLSETFVDCDHGKPNPLTQAGRNEKLPYQETRAFKEVTKEFRKRTISTKRIENVRETEPLISQSKTADKSKEVKQLFPPNQKSRKSNFVSNITNRIVNAFKPMHHKRGAKKSPEVHEMSSTVYEQPCKRYLSDVSSSAGDTTDNNDATWILCKHPPKSSDDDPESNKAKASSSKSKCARVAKCQERSTSIPVFEETKARDDSKLQLSKSRKGSGSILCSPRKESKESIARKHYSQEFCKSKTCSKQNCTSEISDKEIVPSKLTEMINCSVKEAMETLIKQCAMVFKMQDTVRTNDDSRCIERVRCYPCDYPIKSVKRASSKRCKGLIPLCPNLKEACPAKEKKRCKLPENVQTDNRRMTGNVNIYICSEASEKQRKEKQKQKSQSCTGSSSETATGRTDSSCARTSCVSSDKLVSNIETTCETLEEEKLDNCFSMRDVPCAVQTDESNGSCCDRKYDDSLEMDDRFEFSSCESSRSTDIDSMISSTSSTRDGCCCQGTELSSYVDVHHDLSCLKPRFTICNDKFESPCTATIYQKCPYDPAGDSCIQRSVCMKGPRLRCYDSLSRSMDHRCGYYGGVHKCCCKKRPRFRPIRRRSSFDILHTRGLCRKWSRCSCILEEDEMDDPMQRATCRDEFNVGTLNDLEDCRIHKSVDACNVETMTTPKIETIETTKKSSSKCLHKKRKSVSKTHMKVSSVERITPVTKKSTIKIVSSSEKSGSSPKQVCSEVDKNLKNECPRISVKKCVKERPDVKGQKQKCLSEKKSKCTFFGRSIKKAMNIVKHSKQESDRTNCRTKPVQSTKSKTETCFQDEKEKIRTPECLQERKDEETLDGCKASGSSSKRSKTKLQTMLAHKKTSKSEEISYTKKTGDTKKVERVKDTKEKSELIKRKDSKGDFEKDCTKMTMFKGEPESLGCQADSYSYREGYSKKCSQATINRCCYCHLPVVDCICGYHPPAYECHPIVVDNCECDKPKTYDEICQTGNFYRYDVQCLDCHKPKDKCCCKTTCVDHYIPKCQRACNETICVYCEYPKDKCICRAPIRKCSYCNLSFDICKCREVYNGRPIVTDCDGDQKICVTAWKPKAEVRRYFSRNCDAFRSDSLDECCCHETHKAYCFNDLPYQRLSIFSDVMSELQQKISDSVCCERCKMTPCCCRGAKNVEDDERKGRQRSRSPEVEYVRGKSCTSHRCGRSPDRNIQRRTMPFPRICFYCKALPCRCKKGKITIRRPRAKCYYCKSCPCTCISAREFNKTRSCKCGDSPCCAKEKETTACGKAFNDARK